MHALAAPSATLRAGQDMNGFDEIDWETVWTFSKRFGAFPRLWTPA